MGDSDLDELRKRRLAELQSQYKGGASDQDAQQAQEAKAKQQEDAKNSILSQILDQNARARLNTLLLGKPEKGQMVQSMLLRMAQTGQIMSKIGEKELIGLLENVSAQTQSKTSVKFDRRRAALDSDEDDI
ncbi:programmed cell death protein 5 [Anthonomus grandis grandis]|uniref:programmed cell death protein 5 n=1 Tax=Anthonomus grandis grandis TaxID=2921223 RepID=UPI002165A985|nr:programmed cell death protein 5 [Anthonomus grandis grandis]